VPHTLLHDGRIQADESFATDLEIIYLIKKLQTICTKIHHISTIPLVKYGRIQSDDSLAINFKFHDQLRKPRTCPLQAAIQLEHGSIPT
jgi:hypothetical protein